MTKTRFTFLVAVHAFFIRDKKVLLLERANTGYMDGFFSVPAGHVDGNESIATAMMREIKEETGVNVESTIRPAHVMHRLISPSEERIDYFFLIDEWEGEPENNEKEKCTQLVWFDQENLPTKTIPYIKFAWQQIQNKKIFSEFDERKL